MPLRLLALCALTLLTLATPAAAEARALYADPADPHCSDAGTGVQAAPWCGLAPAAGQARGGDVVHLAAGVYRGGFRPLGSGSASAPIRLVADEAGAVIDAGGAAASLKLISVSDWRFEGVTIRGGTAQAVWLEATKRIVLQRVTVSGSAGAGVQLKGAAATTIAGGAITGHRSAGIMELAGSTGTRITGNRIAGNGRGGSIYNGDGIQLGGSGALVSGNTLTGNGDRGLYEHGIYTGAASTGWTIASNTISGSGGANVKASGTGTVRDNRLAGGTHGLVLSDNPAPVTVERNTLTGRAQHLVFVTTGARARLRANTIRQSGRSTASGDASALFVNEAVSLDIRTTVACYENADNLGVGLWINSVAKLGSFAAEGNTYCSRDPRGRHVAYNGSRVEVGRWRSLTGGDGASRFGAAAARRGGR